MSNELLVGAVVALGLAVIATLWARWLRRPAASVHRADDTEVGR